MESGRLYRELTSRSPFKSFAYPHPVGPPPAAKVSTGLAALLCPAALLHWVLPRCEIAAGIQYKNLGARSPQCRNTKVSSAVYLER